ncbi:MAG: Leader peptidase (Prepilin peptidase) / N-methyltransferase [Rhodanobacteraceae bacterium]|jgi:leader peptidase (prepilin peptidase)/N-methyltransferase|nr:MAG: Leader peptidase (Prepilin peptidase) / N-methyltransferase [Rhodanobacteraceae bacterium]
MTDLPLAIWIAAACVLGLIVGSFLNVVILRLPARMEYFWKRDAREMLGLADDGGAPPPDLVRKGSHCPRCGHPLAAWDNVPVLSWLLLRGRCRYCKAPISVQYPLVELLCGLASAVVVWHFGVTWQAGAGLLFTWFLVAAAGIDFRTQLLPDSLTLPLLWLGLLLSLVPVFVGTREAVVGAAAGYLALWAVFWLFKLATGKEGMGYGDFKLFAAAGAWMGWTALLPIIIIAALTGALIGLILLRVRGQDRSVPFAFGPFLAIAMWIWLVAGQPILAAYLNLTGLQ